MHHPSRTPAKRLVSSQDIGSVKLLRMLKDSDDESTSVVPADTRLRRPRSVYSGLPAPASHAHRPSAELTPRTRVYPNHSIKSLEQTSKCIWLRCSTAKNTSRARRVQSDPWRGTIKGQIWRTWNKVFGISHNLLHFRSTYAPTTQDSEPFILRKLTYPSTKNLTSNPLIIFITRVQSFGIWPRIRSLRNIVAYSSPRITSWKFTSPSGKKFHRVVSQACFVVQVGALEDRKTTEEMAAAMISDLTEELERWKTEVREYQQERVMVETWRKQISDLERDLEVALETLQTAEGKVIETEAEKDREIQARLAERQVIVDKLQAEVEKEKLEREKASQEQERSEQQKTKIEALESLIQDMDRKLSQAQQEIEQLEMQTVPAELQDVHQAHFQATQELEHVKGENLKLIKELSEEKSKVTQEQEESGNLLVKLSQLQETIANQLRDNNFLKDQLKRTKLNNQDHEKCQETAEASEYRHKNELERLQKELGALQQRLTQEREQKSHVEQLLQENQVHSYQVQQQLQLQQTQLLQQQTEIMNLRAALEVEQKQSVMLLQQQSAIAAVSAPHFGRRVSLDGELNGSFLMIETSSAFNGGTGSNSSVGTLGDGSSMISAPHSLSASANASSFNTVGTVSATTPTMTHSNALLPPLSRNFENPSLVNQSSHSIGMNAALPPTSAGMSSNASIPAYTPLGGMASTSQQSGYEVEVKPRMIHRSSSGSISGAGNRMSMHGDPFGSSGPSQSVEELTAQLHHLMKEKEKLQADLSKIPLSGGGPMTRRKVEMLEEAMDETERAMSKIRYSLRLRS
ncbi:hypothetical protein CPC16_002042 [Podila verticillata]|nr:hypothetical protein CPC16_002042 [Podila verticillata]